MWVLLVCLVTLSSSAVLNTNTSSSSQLSASPATSTAPTSSSESSGFSNSAAFPAVLVIPIELWVLFLLVNIVAMWWDEYVRATTLARAQAVVVANNTLQQPAMRGMPTLQIQNPASTRPSLDITLADAGSVRSLNSEVFTTSSEPDASTPRQEHTTNF